MYKFDLFNMEDLIKKVNEFYEYVKVNEDTMDKSESLPYPYRFKFQYKGYDVSYSFKYIPRFDDKPFWVSIEMEYPYEFKSIGGCQIMEPTIEAVKERLRSEKYQTQDLVALLERYCKRVSED